MCFGLLHGPMSIVCLMSFAALTLCGCDLIDEDQQGLKLGWVISVEVDWCSHGFLPGFTLRLIGLVAALVFLRMNGTAAEAQTSCLNECYAETDLPGPSEPLDAADVQCPDAQVADAGISGQSAYGAAADTPASDGLVADVVPAANLEDPDSDLDASEWLSYQEWLEILTLKSTDTSSTSTPNRRMNGQAS